MKRIISLLISGLVVCLFHSSYALEASNTTLLISKKSKSVKLETEGKEEKKKKEPINESEFEPVLVGALLENPTSYLNKQIKFRGRFSSFTTLALDYEPALRKSKDYISICLFRADSKIPLSELKLAYPVADAKEDKIIRDLEESDLLEIYGKVFSGALDEPWVDIISIKKIESASKKSVEKKVETKSNTENKKSNKTSPKKTKE